MTDRIQKMKEQYEEDARSWKQHITELMCAMREWYEDGFNRGDCGELIVKHGGEA